VVVAVVAAAAAAAAAIGYKHVCIVSQDYPLR
jgi:hypothetical protein